VTSLGSRCPRPPSPSWYGKYNASGARRQVGSGRRRSMEQEKGEGNGEEEQFPDRCSEELGMQFSLVHRAGYLSRKVTGAGSLGSVDEVNF